MPYIDPKMIDGVLPPQVLHQIHQDYFTWMQSGWKSNNRLPYEHGHNQHYILRHSKSFDIMVGESFFAEELTKIQDMHPNVSVGSYPFSRDGVYGATIVLRSAKESDLDSCESAVKKLISNF